MPSFPETTLQTQCQEDRFPVNEVQLSMNAAHGQTYAESSLRFGMLSHPEELLLPKEFVLTTSQGLNEWTVDHTDVWAPSLFTEPVDRNAPGRGFDPSYNF